MNQELVAGLKKRNARIIEAILKKAQAFYPGPIALIGITGSFVMATVMNGQTWTCVL